MELTKRNVATLPAPASSNRIYFDDATWGLGLRVTAAGARSWVLNYSVAGKQRRFTLGHYPELSLQQARARASDWRDKIKQGVLVREADGSERTARLDPLEERRRERERQTRERQERERHAHEGERTVGRLVELWLAAHGKPNKRESSQESDRSILKCHLLPRFASMPVTAMTKADVKTMMAEMRATGIPVQANRARALLSAIMEFGVEELSWRDSNPCRKVKRFSETGRLVSLTRDDLDRLYRAIEAHPNRQAADTLKLMVWTGARRGEVLGARWSEFDLERAIWLRPAMRLKQKTHSIIPLNELAVDLLQRLHDEASGSPFVFPGDRPGQSLKNIVRPWHQIREAAKLEHVRIHDMRHVFATHALEGGAHLDEIAPLLGHASTVMTRTYAHFSVEALRAATRKAARLLAAPEDHQEARPA